MGIVMCIRITQFFGGLSPCNETMGQAEDGSLRRFLHPDAYTFYLYMKV